MVDAFVSLGAQLAGEPVGEQIGRSTTWAASSHSGPVLLGGELVEGVERQELQAVDGVELVGSTAAWTSSMTAAVRSSR